MQTSEWNQDQISSEFESCSNLGELIQEIESHLTPKGDMVCEVHVNGLFLSEQEEAKFARTPINEIEHLKVRTRNFNELIKESMKSIFDFAPQIKANALEAMESFREGNEYHGQRLLSEAIDGCHWVSEALKLLKPRLIEESKTPNYAQAWAQQEENFRSMVEELLEAFNAQDLILLADVLEYELTTSLDNWLVILRKA